METNSYRVKFDGGNGAALAGIVDRPADSQPQAVAVFSHCFTCNKDLKAIVRISRGLAAHGIAVMRYDMTGLGGSEGDFSSTHFTSNLLDLTTAIEFTRGELGKVTGLVGHSFGGAASLAFAGRNPDSYDAPKAIVSLAAPSDTTHLSTLLLRMNPAIESEGSGDVSIGGRTFKITREMLEDFRGHDLPGLISRIGCPTLLFHSPVDRTVGFDHAIRILGLIQSSPGRDAADGSASPIGFASLVTLPDADHLLAQNARDLTCVIEMASAFLLRFAASE